MTRKRWNWQETLPLAESVSGQFSAGYGNNESHRPEICESICAVILHQFGETGAEPRQRLRWRYSRTKVNYTSEFPGWGTLMSILALILK